MCVYPLSSTCSINSAQFEPDVAVCEVEYYCYFKVVLLLLMCPFINIITAKMCARIISCRKTVTENETVFTFITSNFQLVIYVIMSN